MNQYEIDRIAANGLSFINAMDNAKDEAQSIELATMLNRLKMLQKLIDNEETIIQEKFNGITSTLSVIRQEIQDIQINVEKTFNLLKRQ
jgi:hypothetical protein